MREVGVAGGPLEIRMLTVLRALRHSLNSIGHFSFSNRLFFVAVKNVLALYIL